MRDVQTIEDDVQKHEEELQAILQQNPEPRERLQLLMKDLLAIYDTYAGSVTKQMELAQKQEAIVVLSAMSDAMLSRIDMEIKKNELEIRKNELLKTRMQHHQALDRFDADEKTIEQTLKELRENRKKEYAEFYSLHEHEVALYQEIDDSERERDELMRTVALEIQKRDRKE